MDSCSNVHVQQAWTATVTYMSHVLRAAKNTILEDLGNIFTFLGWSTSISLYDSTFRRTGWLTDWQLSPTSCTYIEKTWLWTLRTRYHNCLSVTIFAWVLPYFKQELSSEICREVSSSSRQCDLWEMPRCFNLNYSLPNEIISWESMLPLLWT